MALKCCLLAGVNGFGRVLEGGRNERWRGGDRAGRRLSKGFAISSATVFTCSMLSAGDMGVRVAGDDRAACLGRLACCSMRLFRHYVSVVRKRNEQQDVSGENIMSPTSTSGLTVCRSSRIS